MAKRSRFNVGKYGAFPYVKLKILEKELDKEIDNIIDLKENLEKKKEDLELIIAQEINYCREEAKNNVKHLERGFDFLLIVSLVLPNAALIYFWTLPNVSFANSWFLIIFSPMVSVFIDNIFSFLTTRDQDNEKYQKALRRAQNRIAINYYKKKRTSKKSIEKKINNIFKEIIELDKEEEFLSSVSQKLPDLQERAKQRERVAKIEAYEGRIRDGSKIVRKRLLKSVEYNNWNCPYCNRKKTPTKAVADHIYPVSKGGLSTLQNMVLICNNCNEKKSDLTLRIFCKQQNYNYNKVIDRLEELGKDV